MRGNFFLAFWDSRVRAPVPFPPRLCLEAWRTFASVMGREHWPLLCCPARPVAQHTAARGRGTCSLAREQLSQRPDRGSGLAGRLPQEPEGSWQHEPYPCWEQWLSQAMLRPDGRPWATSACVRRGEGGIQDSGGGLQGLKGKAARGPLRTELTGSYCPSGFLTAC